MLHQFLIPKLDEDCQKGRVHFQQDGALPHYLEEEHPFPRSVDWSSGASSMATSFPGSYAPRIFLMGIR
jgi:hypothetical protein